MYAAYTVAASWRPASTISHPATPGRAGGEASRQVPPPSVVVWMTPLLVAAQITPRLTVDSEKVVIRVRRPHHELCAVVERVRIVRRERHGSVVDRAVFRPPARIRERSDRFSG